MGERRYGGHRGKEPHWRHDRDAAGSGPLLDRRQNQNGQHFFRFHRQRAQAIAGWYSIRARQSGSVTANHSSDGPRKYHHQERPAGRPFLEKLKRPLEVNAWFTQSDSVEILVQTSVLSHIMPPKTRSRRAAAPRPGHGAPRKPQSPQD